MTISFNRISTNIRRPGVYQETDSSRALSGAANRPTRVLLVGYRTAAGTVAELISKKPTRPEQADEWFGAGSMLALMYRAFHKITQKFDVTCIAINEPGAGTAGTRTLTVTGTATEDGIVSLYIDGVHIQTAVANGDANTAIAAAIEAAIDAYKQNQLNMTAGVASNVVTLTSRHKGVHGLYHDVRLNYYDSEQKLPAGISIAIATGATAAGVVSIPSITAIMGDTPFEYIVNPFRDSQALTDWHAEMNDRWGPERDIPGRIMTAAVDSHANLITLGDANNSEFISIIGMPSMPCSPWEFAARVAAVDVQRMASDPGRPRQTLAVPHTLAPKADDRFTNAEKELQLNDGISTFDVDGAGMIRIERLITTYQENAAQVADTAYLDVTTLDLLMAIRFDWKSRILLKFPDWKLAADGTRFGAGQKVVTPALIKAEAIAQFRSWEDQGMVQDFDQFKDDLVIEINGNDRIDMIMPPKLIGQFRVLANQIQFILS